MILFVYSVIAPAGRISRAPCQEGDTGVGEGFIMNTATNNNVEPKISQPTSVDDEWRAHANPGNTVMAVTLRSALIIQHHQALHKTSFF